jgi:ELWxxDGT repeat protein
MVTIQTRVASHHRLAGLALAIITATVTPAAAMSASHAPVEGDAGGRLVRGIVPRGVGSQILETAAFHGRLIFVRDPTGENNGSVWRTDGTADGTIMLQPPSTIEGPYAPSVAGGRLFFFHPDQNENTNHLYTSDGTVAGTRGVGGWVDGDYAYCRPGEPLGRLYLAGCGSAPWLAFYYEEEPPSGGLLRSDGTNARYLLSFAHTSERQVGMVTDIVRSGRTAYFLVQRAWHDEDWRVLRRWKVALWRTDGTKAGTRRVVMLDLPARYQITGPWDPARPRLVVATAGRLHLSNRDAAHGTEPWVSDGTAGGTGLLRDIRPGPAGSKPSHRALFGRRQVTFRANDGLHGAEPWISDGTRRGTMLLRDIRPGPLGSTPSTIVRAGRRGYFVADDGMHGRELWVTDGTRAGTRMVRDIALGATGAAPTSLRKVGSKLYFVADDRRRGRELWVTDGTRAGTHRVADLRRGRRGSMPTHLTRVGRSLYFVANDGTHGRELWRLIP